MNSLYQKICIHMYTHTHTHTHVHTLTSPDRTAIDLLIAVSHIISTAASLTNNQVGCGIIGTVNQFLLFASNLWYTILAWDLIKAIRNPFR